MATNNRRFPSPCGEKVGINGKMVDHSLPNWVGVSVPLRGKGRDQHEDAAGSYGELLLQFPSPCGEKVGINNPTASATAPPTSHVSVPLRGKGRDQPAGAGAGAARPSEVSVPLRGKGRDQLGAIVRIDTAAGGFRPLAGKR